jgi:hypothetical protein
MKFLHSSSNEIKKITSARDLGCDFKPNGCLWLSCGNAWQKFVSSEGIKHHYKYLYELNVDTRRLVKLSTIKQMRVFQQKFGILHQTKLGGSGSKGSLGGLWVSPPKGGQSLGEYIIIDWDKVRHVTGKCGIWIPNPRQDLNLRSRTQSEWFTGFQICSAAIWNPTCIESMQLIRESASSPSAVRELSK